MENKAKLAHEFRDPISLTTKQLSVPEAMDTPPRPMGALPELEDEMCAFGPGGLPNGRSPDRLDALVWAVSELALKPRAAGPKLRRL